MLAALENDEGATAIAGRTIKRLWQPAQRPYEFPTLAHCTAALRMNPDLDEPYLLREGNSNHRRTDPPTEHVVVLHADLHHFNILSSERGWIAIDPKGVTGFPHTMPRH
jgi:streptomycin 6-kinase